MDKLELYGSKDGGVLVILYSIVLSKGGKMLYCVIYILTNSDEVNVINLANNIRVRNVVR